MPTRRVLNLGYLKNLAVPMTLTLPMKKAGRNFLGGVKVYRCAGFPGNGSMGERRPKLGPKFGLFSLGVWPWSLVTTKPASFSLVEGNAVGFGACGAKKTPILSDARSYFRGGDLAFYCLALFF